MFEWGNARLGTRWNLGTNYKSPSKLSFPSIHDLPSFPFFFHVCFAFLIFPSSRIYKLNNTCQDREVFQFINVYEFEKFSLKKSSHYFQSNCSNLLFTSKSIRTVIVLSEDAESSTLLPERQLVTHLD